MKREVIMKLHSEFEQISHIIDGSEIEFWLARELPDVMGYSEWRNFESVIQKAKIACEKAGNDPRDHFVAVAKMVNLGSGAQREVADIALTRYACYLIAQNGDPRKEPIAFAQTYFAVQTRKHEIIEQRLAEVERIQARRKLKDSERKLSGLLFELLGEGQSFARIRSKGDRKLFGGHTTKEMKERLDIPENRPLADFLPTITIKAKDFANEITNFRIVEDDLETERSIAREHEKSNLAIRKALTGRNITPENLPPEEDLQKLERRLKSETKKLPKQAAKLISRKATGGTT